MHGKTDAMLIEHYLYDEMNTEERESFEERMFAEDELFTEAQEAENLLVDRYVSLLMSNDERAKFEANLERFPARRTKVANAKALMAFIERERPSEATRAFSEKAIWGQILSFFRAPAFAYSMACLAVLFSAAAVLLLIENRRQNEQIASLIGRQSNVNGEGNGESEVERQLADSRAKEAELQTRIDAETNVSGDLTADLEQERDNRRKLESEIANIRKQRHIPSPGPSPEQRSPTIAAITLDPAETPGSEVPMLKLEGKEERISMLLTLPANTDPEQRLSVQLNGKAIAENIKVRLGTNGEKTLPVTLQKVKMKAGQNIVTVLAGGKQIFEYKMANGGR